MARQRTVASRQARRPSAAGGGAAPVGRDDLLGRLRGAVDGAVAGRGLIVLLTGEAGIGKTTLLKEAARRGARAGRAQERRDTGPGYRSCGRSAWTTSCPGRPGQLAPVMRPRPRGSSCSTR